MAWQFRRVGDAYEARLHPGDAVLLRELGADLLTLLDDDDPADPVVRRLFPDARRDDPEAAAELRGLIEDDLRDGKREDARALVALDPDATVVRLAGVDEAERWLRALNDLRLAVGTRLGVSEDMDEPDEDDPRAPAYALYDFLTWLQGSLVQALAGG